MSFGGILATALAGGAGYRGRAAVGGHLAHTLAQAEQRP